VDTKRGQAQAITPGGGVDELYAGGTVSISADDNVVSILIQNKSRTLDSPTLVRNYRYNEKEGLWQPLGSDVYGMIGFRK
jgi:hypothetical protein